MLRLAPLAQHDRVLASLASNDKLSPALCGRDARTTISDDFVSSSCLSVFVDAVGTPAGYGAARPSAVNPRLIFEFGGLRYRARKA